MDFINQIKQRKHIVLPEGLDDRVAEAAARIDFADVTLITEVAAETSKYAEKLYDLRRHKGLTLDGAHELLRDPLYYGVMMVKEGDADGMVAGAARSTADVLRPALQILKTASNVDLVSSFFLVDVPDCVLGCNGKFVFADCALNENPSAEDLASIAEASAESFERLVGEQARVAMLSYSTYGSANSEVVLKVRRATQLIKSRHPDLLVDGEMQLDAALIEEIGAKKAAGSPVAGKANVLVFPDLNSGNIGYKLVERLAGASVYGPITQGLSKPVNDLSRGCSVNDIVGVVALTCLQ